jgi:tyrosyl-tRNA synthetase
MQQFNSPFLTQLQNRGFISQITHPKELDDLMKDQKISAYSGFDCTAKTLHVGNLIQIMVLQILQKHGHQPIVLLGGGTTKIGDPSGKDEARKFLDEKGIAENLAGIEETLKKFDLSLEDSSLPSFKFVNNDDWLKDLKYIDFLRDFGRHFSVNRMLTFESVKLRLDRAQPLSFLEFNYMILQAYDFYELNKNQDCRLQIGGSDQWGNIINGVDLTRRVASENLVNEVQKTGEQVAFISREIGISAINSSVFGLTTPLLTTSDGKKMGKTANGAVWLDSQMLNAFDYFQYFRNVDDADVERFFKLFTHLDLSEIKEIQKEDINRQKEILALETTKLCHGQDQALKALAQAKSIFSGQVDIDSLPTKEIKFSADEIQNGKKLIEILRETALCESGGEAKRLIKGGGIKIDDEKVGDENFVVKFDKKNPFFKIALGKKKFFKINIIV